MAANDSVLCIDIGGESIKAAEFSFSPSGEIRLESFSFSEFGGAAEENSFETMLDALTDIIQSNDFVSKRVHVSVSGHNSFIRFVKVPAMTTDKQKIREIISYEARQTIPFPMDSIVWDSQMIEPADDEMTNEIDAMLVIVKNEDASRIISTIEALGKKVYLLEVASTACYNAARANGVGDSQCEIIINIGSKSSTLVFVDGTRFYIRSIPIAGNAVTQQIAKEFNISFADAEELKRRHGFVALGGAYEEPESEVAATVSKIVRNVMTRLHGEINRSINVYRASQHGRKPERLLLSGGSSVMAYTPKFFQEKLRIPVEYFNPFHVVSLSDSIDQGVLKDVAHLYGEAIGLALRHIGSTPIEINLIPDSVKKQNAFRQKRPFFYASAVSILFFLGVSYWATAVQADRIDQQVSKAFGILNEQRNQFNQMNALIDERNNWIHVFNALQETLPQNVWLTKVEIATAPNVSETVADTPSADSGAGASGPPSGFRPPPMGPPGRSRPMPRPGASAPSASSSDELRWLNISGRVLWRDDYSIQDHNSAMNKLFTSLAKEDGILAESERDIREQWDREESQFNISEFSLSVKLKAPINSPAFQKLVKSVNTPTSQPEK